MNTFMSMIGRGEATSNIPPVKPAILVIIRPSRKSDYSRLFEGCTLTNGRPIEVVQLMWSEFLVTSSVKNRKQTCCLHLCNGEARGGIVPDFLLVRSEVRGVTNEQDFRNSLFGLMFASVPSVNSLHSIYCFLERPVVQGELNKLNAMLGDEIFPVVHQDYFSSHREMMYGNTFPCVVKVGHAHAGFGKMKINDHHTFEDFRTIVALNSNYVTAEPFINGEYDLRIQKIGTHIRAFQRESVCGSWKTNMGSSDLREVEVTDQYRRWIEEAGNLFGGLDICTVDAIFDHDSGQAQIMEVNGTSSGFSPFRTEVDSLHLKELVIEKMNEALV